MADSDKHELGFFLLRYVPDAVKDEFVNIGVVLVGDGADAGYADVRFTRDWRRVLCLDPGADVEWLQALERDVRMRLQDAGSLADLLYRLQDLCSNVIQISASKGCLGEEPAREMESLAKLYLEAAPLRAGKRAPSGRQRIVAAMRRAFEREGVWRLMRQEIAAATYTHKGDPLKIDCAYRPNGIIKMFQAVALSSDVNSAKVLAFSYPEIAEGIAREEKAETELTAVVEDHLDRSDEGILFALAMMERSRIGVAGVSEMPRLAEVARRELRA
ncbi:MAG: DUF3037 domain-containing protein [Terriglobales bacterium]